MAALRITGLYCGRKYRGLLLQFFAAAVSATPDGAAAGVFQKLIYPAASAAFIFIYRHYHS